MYHRINEKRSIKTTTGERRKKWTGEGLRNNTWVTTIFEGKIEGKLGRESTRQSYIKRIMLDIGKGYKSYK